MKNLNTKHMSPLSFFKKHSGLLAALMAIAIFRTVLFDWSLIPSGSMEPTLYNGDYVLINKIDLGPTIPFTDIRLANWGSPNQGDVIIFYPPGKNVQYIKRVIGTPGDIVTINKNNILVNGTAIPFSVNYQDNGTLTGHSTINKHKHKIKFSENGLLPPRTNNKPIPKGFYFVMGDHRTHSQDSRYFGLVPEDNIVGKTSLLLLSLSNKRSFLDSILMPFDQE